MVGRLEIDANIISIRHMLACVQFHYKLLILFFEIKTDNISSYRTRKHSL